MKGIFEGGLGALLGLIDVPDKPEVHLHVTDDLVTPAWKVLHTAVTTSLIEMAGAKVSPHPVVPSSVTVQLIRPAQIGDHVVARATVISAGRTAVFTRTDVFVDDRQIATGVVQFMVVPDEVRARHGQP